MNTGNHRAERVYTTQRMKSICKARAGARARAAMGLAALSGDEHRHGPPTLIDKLY